MAHTDKLEDSTLDAIAKQVGEFFPRLATNVNLLIQPSELGETFAIWLLRAEDTISDTTVKFAELAQNTGRWHSQVRIGGKAQVVARSIPLGGDHANWSVRQIFEGDFAQAIDEAISWLDSNVQNDPLVRVLEVPAYHITALWLVYPTEDNVVIARQPDGMQHLRRLTLYSSRDFLENLRKEQFIIGILPSV